MLTLTAVNDAPVAVADAYATNADAPLAAVLVVGPAHGTLSLNADGSFLYAPEAGYSGPDSFIYRTSNGTALSAIATVLADRRNRTAGGGRVRHAGRGGHRHRRAGRRL